ncbi:MAG: excinuclease ABC subunit UvrA [Atopobiaceae bacterium]|jgi:excinuclease ABC subunit A|nr:excinuclease ABC subunit UvrA [Atopobiaceae bacterium]MCI1345052.1 excinuclease ABC subunit UvrA [Atopobiaceae bacterium]MCI1497931.1 excinuclease ABC subunit UvrA [Atopobiaceae bacterium]MCI1539658.1 excinuclease ABC subunit UvrA [Atopobiaceae bacterium]
MKNIPEAIEVHGARVHNLRSIDVDVPLHEIVGIAGVSGSGKSSLALGVLYAEGSRRYLEALSTYTRRRLTQAARADVDEVRYVPAALALHQRPPVPGIRSTFGTMTEVLNSLRLLFSRVGSYKCPNGHRVPPSMNVALEKPLVCPTCGARFSGLGAEQLAFNSDGACPACGGTGTMRVVDESTLVPDESNTIDEGAVAPWGTLMWSLMKDVCREMGVRTDVPFSELTLEEREIVYHGPAEKRHVVVHNKSSNTATELDFTYYSAVASVENALSKAKTESAFKRIARFLKEEPCPVCCGTRLSEKARNPEILGMDLAEATKMTVDELALWLPKVVPSLPEEVQAMGASIIATLDEPLARLKELGLGYLALDRAGSTLSTGERQRVQLARAVRNRTTGVLYVLDEPSIGLHPANVEGLLGVMDDLLVDGNSVVVVDHDVHVLEHAEHLIEVGPGSGKEGGRIIAQGTPEEVAQSPDSRIAPYLMQSVPKRLRPLRTQEELFSRGALALSTNALHTVHSLEVRLPLGALTVVTGVSGSGKTTLVLECLVPALEALSKGEKLPPQVRTIDPSGIRKVHLIDSTPIGANVRSTVATYSGVMDELRRAFAQAPSAKERGLHAGDFSYNTGSLRCPVCDGTGTISLDVQFLPDVEITCPSCHGGRFGDAAWDVKRSFQRARKGTEPELFALPELMEMTIDEALEAVSSLKSVHGQLQVLHDLGLGYLTLGEATPALSGGEAQRLKLAGEMERDQKDALFVFDEPTIGLHPHDVEMLEGVLQTLIDHGATVLVIEHDLDMIANADWMIDMGPGGGEAGGRIVYEGVPAVARSCPASVTGRYL